MKILITGSNGQLGNELQRIIATGTAEIGAVSDVIKTAEIALGYSFRVRGYRYSMMGYSYIIFRDTNNKYLFKVINCPETNEFFSKCFEIQ